MMILMMMLVIVMVMTSMYDDDDTDNCCDAADGDRRPDDTKELRFLAAAVSREQDRLKSGGYDRVDTDEHWGAFLGAIVMVMLWDGLYLLAVLYVRFTRRRHREWAGAVLKKYIICLLVVVCLSVCLVRRHFSREMRL